MVKYFSETKLEKVSKKLDFGNYTKTILRIHYFTILVFSNDIILIKNELSLIMKHTVNLAIFEDTVPYANIFSHIQCICPPNETGILFYCYKFWILLKKSSRMEIYGRNFFVLEIHLL